MSRRRPYMKWSLIVTATAAFGLAGFAVAALSPEAVAKSPDQTIPSLPVETPTLPTIPPPNTSVEPPVDTGAVPLPDAPTLPATTSTPESPTSTPAATTTTSSETADGENSEDTETTGATAWSKGAGGQPTTKPGRVSAPGRVTAPRNVTVVARRVINLGGVRMQARITLRTVRLPQTRTLHLALETRRNGTTAYRDAAAVVVDRYARGFTRSALSAKTEKRGALVAITWQRVGVTGAREAFFLALPTSLTARR